MRLVKAAVRTEDGKVYTGTRHADCIKAAIADGVEKVTQEMQGFVDDGGTYWTRFQAAVVACRWGQMPHVKRPLLSEDLW